MLTDEELEARDAEYMRDEWRKNMAEKIGPRHSECSVAGFETFGEEPLKLAQLEVVEWLKAFEPGVDGLMLYGPPGTGKTHLLAAASLHLAGSGYAAAWIRLGDYLEGLKRSYDRHGEPRMSIGGLTSNYHVVMFDDFAVEKPTEWAAEEVYRLIDALYRARVTICVSSNEPYSGIAKKFGERVADRLVEVTKPVHLSCDSYRVRTARARRANG